MQTLVDNHQRSELRLPFDRMAENLRLRTAGRRVYFLITNGNYGDALIGCGARLFLNDIGIRYRTIDISSKKNKIVAASLAAADPYGRRSVFLFNGSGAWAEHCSVGLRAVARQMALCADVIVLPSTIETMPLQRRPTIYRRDQSGSRAVMPDAPFCHDMAFYLGLLPETRWFPGGSSIRIDKERGVFFRQDNESRISRGSSVPGNDDLSWRGDHRSDVQDFLREIARCAEVITDRLHVAIGGILLGREVILVPGTTFKIRAIYEASIEPYFDNCTLASDDEALRRATGHNPPEKAHEPLR